VLHFFPLLSLSSSLLAANFFLSLPLAAPRNVVCEHQPIPKDESIDENQYNSWDSGERSGESNGDNSDKDINEDESNGENSHKDINEDENNEHSDDDAGDS
jgi:hypothetical protein